MEISKETAAQVKLSLADETRTPLKVWYQNPLFKSLNIQPPNNEITISKH